MLTRSFLTLISWMLLCSCATSAESVTYGVQADDKRNCETSDARPPVVKHININYMADPIVVAPSRICVRPGDVLKFQLNGNPNVEVKVEGKGPGDEWISGNNAGRKQVFFVLVPLNLLPDSVEDPSRHYFYSVIAGDQELDPEVRVRNDYY